MTPGPFARGAGLVRRFIARPADDRRLLSRAALTQALVIAGLRCGIAPATLVARVPVLTRAADPDRVAAAVTASSVVFGSASHCLSRAIAVHAMLRGDAAVTTVLGIDAVAAGSLDAHAWVERNGRPLLGAAGRHGAVARLEGGGWRRA